MIQITSFGYLHGGAPSCGTYARNLVLDARDLIRDPHVDPALRQMTGREYEVRVAVMETPGANALVDLLVQAAIELDAATDDNRRVHVAIGCQGGRHRSVVLADVIGEELSRAGREVQIHHHDIDKPVVKR